MALKDCFEIKVAEWYESRKRGDVERGQGRERERKREKDKRVNDKIERESNVKKEGRQKNMTKR